MNSFISLVKHPIKFRLFLFLKLPAALFSGVKVVAVDRVKCIVSVPYKWFTRNPFRSTYFACLSMAAEMSTGVLCMMSTYKWKPPVSMLVKNIEGNFIKKATGKTKFICSDGEEITACIKKAIDTGEVTTIRAKSIGSNDGGETVAEFYITWSFKRLD